MFTGVIPSFFSNLTRLRDGLMSRNFFTETLPASIISLDLLETLWIGNMILSESIPSFIGNLMQLRIIDLSHNLLKGTILSSLCVLKKLYETKVKFNQLTETVSL